MNFDTLIQSKPQRFFRIRTLIRLKKRYHLKINKTKKRVSQLVAPVSMVGVPEKNAVGKNVVTS